MADLLNTTLGNRYTIHERIGAGGMARVFKARDGNLDRWVAIKVLHEHLSEEPSFSERFTREAKLVASLNHPNIVQVYDYSSFERDGIPIYYMVMPLISGETLRAILDRCAHQGIRLPRQQVIAIVGEICVALGYAHERGMAHRDIKPGNIIVDETGRPILTDFGIARMVEATRLTQDSTTTGTPAYMSPEQVNGQPGDARSDLYSLAVMLYEMWTGRLPFVDDSPAGLIVKHLYAPIPTIGETTGVIEPAVDSFMQCALAKSPDQRFPTAQSFVEALMKLPAGEPIDPPTLPGPPMPGALKQPTPISAFAPGARATLPLSEQSLDAAKNRREDTTQFLARTFRKSFLYLVAALVLVILGLVALERRASESSPAGPDPNAIPAMDPATDLNQEGFTANFNPDDADRARFPTNPEERGITRILLDDVGAYRIVNANFPSASTTLIDADKPYGNVTITMVATLEDNSAPDSGYGIIFRYQDDDNYNVFAVDGLGRYSIWVREAGQWRELERQEEPERWETNSNVLTIGEANRLRINVTQEALTLFINNQPVTEPLVDDTFAAGNVGIYIAAPESGIADVLVDMFEVYPIIPSMTEPGRMG